jgi:hypothetical protein
MLASVVGRLQDEFLTRGKGGGTVPRAARDKILAPEIMSTNAPNASYARSPWEKTSWTFAGSDESGRRAAAICLIARRGVRVAAELVSQPDHAAYDTTTHVCSATTPM